MKSQAPAKLAASEPVAPAREALPAPEPMKSASETPVAAPEQTAPQQTAKVMTPGVGIGPTDNPALDAPMTFTMDNVPPAQKEGSSTQLAAEAPAVTTGPSAALRPNAPVNSAEPTPFVAPQTPSLPQ